MSLQYRLAILWAIQEKNPAATRHAAKLYWLKKKHIDQDNFDSIHWSALHQAHRESSQSHQAFVIKSSVGMCGVGKFLKRWKQSSTSACPRFSADSEDITHVWKSPAPEVKDLWTTTIANLRTWLDEQHTDPRLSNILLTYLHCWRESLPFPEASNRLHDLVQNQSDIGWDGPFYGWMSQHWANIQQDFDVQAKGGLSLLSKKCGTYPGIFGIIGME